MEQPDILGQIGALEKQANTELGACATAEELEAWRIRYLGRKSALAALTAALPALAPEARREAGRSINTLKQGLLGAWAARTGTAEKETEARNFSFPGTRPETGRYHPLTIVTREMADVFLRMGFGVATGPDIETDYYNFQALNTPPDHPARDIWDTFYLNERQDILLRTHTSPVQIRTMEHNRPPFRIIAFGRCFRKDAFDASHSPMFHQMEGLMVGPAITFADLKGMLTFFLQEMFGRELKVRFLPSYFPFTEPSAEVSISCIMCGGEGCAVCKQSGWIEILGCGTVHPQVFRNVGLDPEQVTGFAFGMGIERIAMIKYGITDIRHFTQNDLRFIEQFS